MSTLAFFVMLLVTSPAAAESSLADRLEPRRDELGAAGLALLRDALRSACAETFAGIAPRTCALAGTVSVGQIRAAVLEDIVAVLVARLPAGDPGRTIAASLGGAPLETWLRAFGAPEELAAFATAADAGTVAARGAARAATLTLATDTAAVRVHEVTVRWEAAHRASAAYTASVGPASAEAARALVRSYMAFAVASAPLFDLRLRSDASERAEVVASIAGALLSDNPRPAALDALVARAVTADAERLRFALRLLAVESRRDSIALARSLLLTLPPWTEALVFDVNGSVPVLGNATKLNGDLLLGYNGGSYGAQGFGSALRSAYDDVAGRRVEVDRYEGRLELYVMPAVSSGVRLDLRLRGGALLYDSGTSGVIRGGNALRPDETSLVGHGGGSVGVRLAPSDRVALLISAGGGFEVEDFSAVDVAGRSLTVRNETPTTARGELRVRGQWNVVPSYLALRARVDGALLSLTRTNAATTAGTNTGISTVISTVRFQQTELVSRLFVDIDALAFFDFRPSTHVGVDVYGRSGEESSIVPVFGVGVRREAF